MDFLETIKAIAQNGKLNKTQELINVRATQAFRNSTIAPQGQFNIEFRDLIKANASTEVKPLYSTYKEAQPLFERITFYPNMIYTAKAPYISFNGIVWREEGTKTQETETTIYSKPLKPHRICTQIKISNELLNNTSAFDEQIKEQLIKAIYAKVIETMLSTNDGTSDAPKGLIDTSKAKTISTLEDLYNFQYEGDKNKCDNVFIVSPKAKRELHKLSNNFQLLNNNQLLNAEAICENLCEDGYLLYAPLSSIVAAQWGALSLTIDNMSDIHNGNVIVYIDAYFDFAALNESLVNVAVFAEPTEEPTEEPKEEVTEPKEEETEPTEPNEGDGDETEPKEDFEEMPF